MDKNVVWATVLSALFLFSWYHFFSPVPPPNKELSAQSSTQGSSTISSNNAMQKGLLEPMGVAPLHFTERVLEASASKISIDSRGAAVKHWQLKEIKGKSLNPFFDLVNQPEGENSLSAEQFPLSTYPELSFTEVRSNSNESVWRAILPSGVEIEKRYALQESLNGNPSYFLNLTILFRNTKSGSVPVPGFHLGWGPGLGTVESEKKENQRVTRLLAYPSPTKEVVKFKTGEDTSSYRWVGVDNRYYLLAIFPEQGKFSRIQTEKSKTNPGELSLIVDNFILNSGENKIFNCTIYGGPKGYTHLKSLGLSLEHAVDFGYFGFLGKWALKALEKLHGWFGNYGWSIILLTCLLQVFLLPLTLKSYQSTQAMKKIQPKIQELQKRYKDDSKRLNQELLGLYKGAKTNPFGGCIPMVLQIPVFWAFFTMLRNAYELKGAPWIFWITDLSQKDPSYVLPVVMGGGMFLQQKISGTAGADPAQAKMMAFMPILFTFMFLKFPSGLVLYWLTNSAFSILTQTIYNRRKQIATV